MKIKLDDKTFAYIEVHKTTYLFEKVNSGRVICRDCKKEIGAEMGIYRQSYKRAGFLCFSCFSRDIEIINKDILGRDLGFFVDSLERLRACDLSSPRYSTSEIVNSVFQALIDRSYTSIDILLGSESASVWAILDAAEAALGS